MKIKIKISDCKHLKERSYYNHNFYQLPFLVDNGSVIAYDILYERYGSDESFLGNVIGYINMNDDFVPCFYLHCELEENYFIIDTETINKENKWT